MLYSLMIIGLAAAAALWLWVESVNLRRAAYGSGYNPYSSSDERVLMRMFLAAGGVVGTIIMPVVIWKWMRRMNRWDFWRWLLMLVAVGAFHVFVTALGTKSSPKMTWANYLFPSGAFLVEPSARAQINSRFEETDPVVVDTRRLSPREQNLRGGPQQPRAGPAQPKPSHATQYHRLHFLRSLAGFGPLAGVSRVAGHRPGLAGTDVTPRPGRASCLEMKEGNSPVRSLP